MMLGFKSFIEPMSSASEATHHQLKHIKQLTRLTKRIKVPALGMGEKK